MNESKSSFLLPSVFLVFLALKLADIGVVADWSWWWVTSPLWIPFGIVAGLIIVGLALLGLQNVYRLIFWSKDRRERERALSRARRALDSYSRSFR